MIIATTERARHITPGGMSEILDGLEQAARSAAGLVQTIGTQPSEVGGVKCARGVVHLGVILLRGAGIPVEFVEGGAADDHALVRQGLLRILGESPDMLVVGEAEDGAKALNLVREFTPDVLVLDYTIPELDGVSVTEQVRRERPGVKILVLTMHANVHYALKMLQAGAHGYVVKAASAEELVEAIRSVHRGSWYVSPVLVPHLARHLSQPSVGKLDSLSPREFQVLRLMGAGAGINECANALHISESAASTFRGRIMRKLQIRTTGELIRFALENGIVG
jgi:DNA-binding NarL/FixJ family response regulator